MARDSSTQRTRALKRSVFVLILVAGIFDGVALVGTVSLGIAPAYGDGTLPPVVAAAAATLILGFILVSIVRRASAGRSD
jgi:hypothetical protein